ncbi:recombinase family protein [Streptomyces spectabilis]|uniref:Recombinase family protein n=1 Tax=Streptomyces spectabilis TaxID=68270 RepID=A0A516RA11_STRST|nr:recombinase family protein [Streptomyces spectabilis]QDQ12483.1 recombinase family protein [Streptomyces spectabilis]
MATATLTRSAGTLSVPTGGMEMTTQGGVCGCHGRPWVDLLLRKSKIVREGERALSIRAQEDRGRAWADEHGYCVRKVWKENLSAWSDVQRPKYDAAMAAVMNGEVPCLWVYALDRFSRKGAEAVVPILGKARVIFDYERLDSMDERDRRWIIDRAENAREYSQRLSYNVRTTKGKQRNEGRWLAKAPFGLVADKETRRLSPDLSPYLCVVKGRRELSPWEVVVRIFTEIAEGVSSRALARKFNEEGIRSSTGKFWRADSIRAIVIHPVYEGWLTVSPGGKSHKSPVHYVNDKGERVRCVEPDVLPDMISATLAARARRVLSGNQIIDNTPVEGKAVHALSGKMRCASCTNAMVLDGKSYNCQRRAAGGACPGPASAWREAIERYVVQQWADRLYRAADDDPLMIAVAERWQALTRPDENAEIKEARAELKAAQAKLDKFMADDAADFYTGRSAKYRIPHKNAAEKRLDAAEERVKELTGGGRVDLSFLMEGHAEATWRAADPMLRRDLLGLAIESVTVTKSPGQGKRFKGDERVSIVWATPEGAEPDADEFEQAA